MYSVLRNISMYDHYVAGCSGVRTGPPILQRRAAQRTTCSSQRRQRALDGRFFVTGLLERVKKGAAAKIAKIPPRAKGVAGVTTLKA